MLYRCDTWFVFIGAKHINYINLYFSTNTRVTESRIVCDGKRLEVTWLRV